MEGRVLDYLPPVLREVRDFQCLMEAYQGEVSDLWRGERETEDNFYLFTADERGLLHWETILGISPRMGSSLEERRLVIAARISQSTPYDWGTFLAFLRVLMGREDAYSAVLSGLRLEIRLMPPWRGMRDLVWDLVRYVVPANIEALVIPVYNTHAETARWTHGEMTAFTHWQLRHTFESEMWEYE